VETPPDRTRALVEAGIALSSELSLDSLLQKLGLETRAELVRHAIDRGLLAEDDGS
jgi:hypothetical protein